MRSELWTDTSLCRSQGGKRLPSDSSLRANLRACAVTQCSQSAPGSYYGMATENAQVYSNETQTHHNTGGEFPWALPPPGDHGLIPWTLSFAVLESETSIMLFDQ